MDVTNEMTFGGISTTTYSVIVAGYGEYGAPNRAVTLVEVPGRNGSIVLDQGYYENITIKYDLVVKATDQSAFKTAVDSYRNAIVSQLGYQRLTDTYHPNEYRMAMYAGGFEDEPQFHGRSAIFTLEFNCKPQRFLTSGETAVAVANNGTVTNPTKYASSPLLEVWGYGSLTVNGYPITINNETYGHVLLANPTHFNNGGVIDFSNIVTFSNGDTINVGPVYVQLTLKRDGSTAITNASITSETYSTTATSSIVIGDVYIWPAINVDGFTLSWGTSATKTYQLGLSVTMGSAITGTATLTIAWDGAGKITLSTSETLNGLHLDYPYIGTDEISGDSTKSILGNPTYIDAEIGEVYKHDSGEDLISLNQYVELGSDLPTLSPGSNTVTYNNTITSFKVVPRWWQL